MLDGTEMVLKGHWLHRSGEVELKVLKEILRFRVEGGGREGGERLVETTGGPVQNGVLPIWTVPWIDRLVLHDLSEVLLGGRQFQLVSALSGTQMVEPLLLWGG